MPTSALDPVANSHEDPTHADGPVRRSPFYLTEQAGPLFAWIHCHAEETSLDHGVVICPPIGYEQIHSHRSLRVLSDRLAQARLPVVRFDWDGTGDSAGIDEDPHRYRTWLSNIGQAIRWLKQRFGCRRVSLVGLRLGATLSALSTIENEIDNLVLWSPVIKGRTYAREMKAISLTSDAPARIATSPSTDIEAAGFILSSETAADLGRIDLSTLRPECRKTLVVSRSEQSEDDRLCHQWATAGVRVQQVTVTGYAEMMAEPHRSEVPHDAIHQITDWLSTEVAISARPLSVRDLDREPTTARMSDSTASNNGGLQATFLRESAVSFGVGGELFGIVSESASTAIQGRPTIVLLNGGSAHRVGPNRINVLIARRLTQLGFRCVRVDLGGLGDSLSDETDSDRFSDPYPATAFQDIDQILKQLGQRLGAKSFVLIGLCSGAYNAFQAAAQITDPALIESVLINPLTYFWKEGMTLDDSPTKHLRNFHYYQNSALNPKKWLKLLTGRSKIGVNGAVSLLARQLNLVSDPQSAPSQNEVARQLDGLSHPEKENLAGDLKRITLAGRQLAMFFSASDPGYAILNYHARREARRMRANGTLNIKVIQDADHTFTMRGARVDLMDALCGYLVERFPVESGTSSQK